MAERAVSVERVIRAPASDIFDLLADPSMHPVLDGSGTVRGAHARNPKRLRLDSKFGMNMRTGVPYRIRNTVVEFEEGRLIAWRHFGRHRWRWELEPVEGGTKVTETFDYSTSIAPWALERLGYPERNRTGIEATLERLAQRFEKTGG